MIRVQGRDVAVTGVGLVSPFGSSLEAFGDAVLAGRSAGAPVTTFDASHFPTSIAAQVSLAERIALRSDELLRPWADADDWKSVFGIAAARRALDDALWQHRRPPSNRIAVVLGTGLSSLSRRELEEDFVPFLEERGGPRTADQERIDRESCTLDLARFGRQVLHRAEPASPKRHLTDGVNRAVSHLADANGRSLSHFGACAASTQAIGDAYRMIRDGYADAAIAGGMDSMVHPFGMISFMLLGALSTRNDTPGAACRPFHRDRDGFLMGEGAAMFVLELESRAKERGAKIYGRIAGYGASVDGYNVTAPRPDGAGAAAAMRHALKDGGFAAADVGYVNAHGTGTGLNDTAEAKAVRAVFGEARVPISSVKPVFGHTIAAAGAMEVAACLAAMASDRLPPTPNLTLDAVDPECVELDHIVGSGRTGCPAILMTNNYGFGGQNASLLLERVG